MSPCCPRWICWFWWHLGGYHSMRIRPFYAKMMLKPPVLIVNEAFSMCIYPLMLMIKPGFRCFKPFFRSLNISLSFSLSDAWARVLMVKHDLIDDKAPMFDGKNHHHHGWIEPGRLFQLGHGFEDIRRQLADVVATQGQRAHLPWRIQGSTRIQVVNNQRIP